MHFSFAATISVVSSPAASIAVESALLPPTTYPPAGEQVMNVEACVKHVPSGGCDDPNANSQPHLPGGDTQAAGLEDVALCCADNGPVAGTQPQSSSLELADTQAINVEGEVPYAVPNVCARSNALEPRCVMCSR